MCILRAGSTASSDQACVVPRNVTGARGLLGIVWKVWTISKDVREVAAEEFPDEQAAGGYDSLGEPGASNNGSRHCQSRADACACVRKPHGRKWQGRGQLGRMDRWGSSPGVGKRAFPEGWARLRGLTFTVWEELNGSSALPRDAQSWLTPSGTWRVRQGRRGARERRKGGEGRRGSWWRWRWDGSGTGRGRRDTEGGEDLRKQAYRQSSRQSVSPSVGLSHRWPSRSPAMLAQSPSAGLDGPRLARAAHVAATPPRPRPPRCDRALQHPALGDLMFQRRELGGEVQQNGGVDQRLQDYI